MGWNLSLDAWVTVGLLSLVIGFWLALVIEYWNGHTIGGCKVCQSGEQVCPHCGGKH